MKPSTQDLKACLERCKAQGENVSAYTAEDIRMMRAAAYECVQWRVLNEGRTFAYESFGGKSGK